MVQANSAPDGEYDSTRRSVLLGLGASATGILGGAGTVAAQEDDDGGEDDGDDTTETETPEADGSDDNGGDDDNGVATTTRLRVAHVAAEVPAIDVYVDGEAVFSEVEFGDVTDYASLDQGIHEFEVTPAGDDDAVVQVTAAAGPGEFTVAALGGEDAPAPLLLQDADADDADDADDDEALLRVVHAAPDAPAVTVTTGGGLTLVEDLSFAGATEYVSVPAGERTIQVRAAEDSDTVVAEFTVEVSAGEAYTAFAVPDDPVDLVAAQDSTDEE